jgi:glycosyltransferase involved in cell wall biosynthesis
VLSEAGCEVFPLAQHASLYNFGRLVSTATRRLGDRKVQWEVEPILLRAFTRHVQRQAAAAEVDVLLLCGWYPLGVRPSDRPMVFYGDATIAQRVGKSPHWSKLAQRTISRIPRTEAEGLASVTSVVMASTAALEDVRSRYGIAIATSHHIGFGANVDSQGASVRTAPKQPLRLLSIGVHWERKGMDTTVRAADELIAGGAEVILDIAGVRPPSEDWRRPYVNYHGFLNRGNADDEQTLKRLYKEADVFILASRSEPFGIVFAEAAAYGLPSVGPSTGGVPDVIDHPRTGFLVPPDSRPSDYASAVHAIVEDAAVYRQMSAAALQRYASLLTWEASARRLLPVLVRAAGLNPRS